MKFDLREFLAAPGRRRQLAVAAVSLVALAGAFELGQVRAGHNALAAEIAQRRLGRQIAALESERRAASEQLTRLQTDSKIDREAYARVEEQLAELQAKIIEQQEEVAFYRGVIGGPGEGGLKIQDYALTTSGPDGVRLRFVLAQSERAEREVKGQMQVRVEGTRGGRLVSLDLASLAAGGTNAAPFAFNFRYFQDVAIDLRLPGDFTPQRVVIRVLPATKGVKDSVESFPWVMKSA